MGTKTFELTDPTSTLNKAFADEPIFILRAQDLTADGLVEQWANRAEKRGCPKDKCDEARRIAQAMRDWPVRKTPD